MEYSIDVRAVEVIVLNTLQEVILMLVVDELKTTQVLVILPVLQIIHDQDVCTTTAIKFFDDITADKTGTACYDNDDKYLPSLFQRSQQFFPADGIGSKFRYDNAGRQISQIGTFRGP